MLVVLSAVAATTALLSQQLTLSRVTNTVPNEGFYWSVAQYQIAHHRLKQELRAVAAGEPANEHTPFRPRSPYAVAKASAFWLVDNYREAYGLHACSGILFNHESPLRPSRFVTQKIIGAAWRIANGSTERLQLGRLDVARDWGWAPEYVVAMHRMLQQDTPRDYVIATGHTHTLEQFVETAFSQLGLVWQDHVEQRQELMRPNELRVSRADPSLAAAQLRWQATSSMTQVVSKMIDALRATAPPQ